MRDNFCIDAYSFISFITITEVRIWVMVFLHNKTQYSPKTNTYPQTPTIFNTGGLQMEPQDPLLYFSNYLIRFCPPNST